MMFAWRQQPYLLSFRRETDVQEEQLACQTNMRDKLCPLLQDYYIFNLKTKIPFWKCIDEPLNKYQLIWRGALLLAEHTRKSGPAPSVFGACALRFSHRKSTATAKTWLPNLNFHTAQRSSGWCLSPWSPLRRLTTRATLWPCCFAPSWPWWVSALASAGTHEGETDSCDDEEDEDGTGACRCPFVMERIETSLWGLFQDCVDKKRALNGNICGRGKKGTTWSWRRRGGGGQQPGSSRTGSVFCWV